MKKIDGAYILLAILVPIFSGCGEPIVETDTSSSQTETIPNVSSLDLVTNDGVIYLSWANPKDADFRGVEIRRRDDGSYPETPTEGLLIHKSSLPVQDAIDVVSLDTSTGPVYHYYTVFSYSDNENYSVGVRAGLYCDRDGCVSVPDLRDLNGIRTSQDVEDLRKKLINVIWGSNSLPSSFPAGVSNYQDSRYSNANTIDEILIEMGYGITSKIRYYSPFSANRKLMIYHSGHRGNTERDIEIIQRLLKDGFHVMHVSMPLIGANYNPFGIFKVHDDFIDLSRPTRLFLEPVSVGLNYVLSGYSFDAVYMMGISGGGWTTILSAALDTRIAASYSIAGSYPFYLREQLGTLTFGDFEQVNAEFYQHVSYIELYLLGTANRRQLQIFNMFDDCCFEGSYSNSFKDYLIESATNFGGVANIVIDDTSDKHEISDFAFNLILSDIAKDN